MLYTIPNAMYKLEALILFNCKVFFKIIRLKLKELENGILIRLKAISALY
jgi:hypothetical protein